LIFGLAMDLLEHFRTRANAELLKERLLVRPPATKPRSAIRSTAVTDAAERSGDGKNG
jgi:hypothetical protein